MEHQEKENKRILLSISQQMRVAAKAKRLSRKMLEQCTVLFAPDTIMRWYRKIIAQKDDGSQNHTYAGRPQIPQEVVDLIIRFKQKNPRWSYLIEHGYRKVFFAPVSETVAYMIGVFEMQAKNGEKGTKMYKLTLERKQFYSTLLNSTPPFAGTYLEHVSLNDAAKKLISN